jgi:hypothetical protein
MRSSKKANLNDSQQQNDPLQLLRSARIFIFGAFLAWFWCAIAFSPFCAPK